MTQSASNHSAMRVLVVEDDADTRASLCDVLELDGYDVQTAATCAATLARDDLPGFGAIILDRRLPDGTADELLPQLKERAPETAIIVVTGYGDLQSAIAAMRLGATDYTLKPVNADVLRASLARVAERQRLATEKVRAESAFRTLVEAAPCIITISRLDGQVLYVNPFAARVTGLPGETAGLAILRSEAHQRVIAPAVGSAAKALKTAPSEQSFEEPLACANGSLRWVVWHAKLLDDYDGAPAVMAVGQDITELKAAQHQALQRERLAAIGEMIAGLTHESRNALQRSKACLEMLAIEVEDRPAALDLIARLSKAQDHLQRLYEEVRSYAAPITLARTSCDLAHLWREIWSQVEAVHSAKAIELHEETNGNDLACHVDRFALGQVFRNILENAVGAMTERGEIRVRCLPTMLEGKPALEVSFLDTGPGLSAEQRQRIFEPFFTTKAKGTGLGMAIAKRIVDSHGGQISVRDRPPPGAEIVITVPRGPA